MPDAAGDSFATGRKFSCGLPLKDGQSESPGADGLRPEPVDHIVRKTRLPFSDTVA